MGLPTLLVKGSLKDYNGNKSKNEAYKDIVPIDYILDKLNTMLNKVGIQNRVLLVKAMTASGKSTALPGSIYTKFCANVRGNKRGLICTQPRTITAINNVTDIIKHYDHLILGKTIGWSTKFNKLRPLRWGFLSATTGTLTMQLKSLTDEEIMSKYQFILIDEVHERRIETDMALYYLNKFIQRNSSNPLCPVVILMSATFTPEPFLNFFGVSFDNFIYVEGRSYPIETHWLEEKHFNKTNFKAAAEIVHDIHNREYKGDILIFVTGLQEINMMSSELYDINKKIVKIGKIPFNVSAINKDSVSSNSIDYQNALFIPIAKQSTTIDGTEYKVNRKVIISTNIAETGLTINGLGHVIDLGFTKTIINMSTHNTSGLIRIVAPQSSVAQRKGRVGRVSKGDFYPIYTEDTWNHMLGEVRPDIITDDPTNMILSVINEKPIKLGEINLLTQLTDQSMTQIIERLYKLGFIHIRSQDDRLVAQPITKFAELLSTEIDLESIRMIFAGFYWNVSIIELITIAAWLKTSKIKKINREFIYEYVIKGYNSSMDAMFDDFIDGLLIYYFVDKVMHDGSTNPIAYYNEQISLAGLENGIIEFLENREILLQAAIAAELKLGGKKIFDNYYNLKPLDPLKHAIYDGFKLNVARMDNDEYYLDHGKLQILVHVRNNPKHIIVHKAELKINKKDTYDIVGDKYCSLDGYVPLL